MMYNYPFSSFPGSKRPYQYYPSVHNLNVNNMRPPNIPYIPSGCPPNTYTKSHNNINYDNSNSYNNNKVNNNFNNCKNNFDSSKCDNNNNNCKTCEVDDENQDFFDFFGIRLAFDDLLIIALLFFLYKEETKDPYLYISLVLLLLS